jgi:hypothetical protein
LHALFYSFIRLKGGLKFEKLNLKQVFGGIQRLCIASTIRAHYLPFIFQDVLLWCDISLFCVTIANWQGNKFSI